MPLLINLLSKLLMSLATEAVLKKVIIRLAEAVVERTENKIDDDLVKTVREAWGE